MTNATSSPPAAAPPAKTPPPPLAAESRPPNCVCPACETAFHLSHEYELALGDGVDCPYCATELRVAQVPCRLRLEPMPPPPAPPIIGKMYHIRGAAVRVVDLVGTYALVDVLAGSVWMRGMECRAGGAAIIEIHDYRFLPI